MTPGITIEIAPGELIDKLTILAIKLDRITDPAKRANVLVEHDLLDAARRAAIPPSADITALIAALREVNERLWDIEDRIRDCERIGDFGADFVALARAVYKTNDKRAALKRDINRHLGSRLVEEKSYSDY
jgi:post-segregation antitoxin (ccd killing protein)